jgi:hypothetical protein
MHTFVAAHQTLKHHANDHATTCSTSIHKLCIPQYNKQLTHILDHLTTTTKCTQVAHENKELLSKEYPLILAVPPGGLSPNSLPMIDASVGPNLKWSLSSVNHVLRTASKYNEPTYIFAGILDNDPQAFVAVTLRKGKLCRTAVPDRVYLQMIVLCTDANGC